MFTIDLKVLNNSDVYRDCKITEVEGKLILNTPLPLQIIASNVLKMVMSVPNEERDILVLTGGVPPEVSITVYSTTSPFFKKVRWYNGMRQIETEIPAPPDTHNAEPE